MFAFIYVSNNIKKDFIHHAHTSYNPQLGHLYRPLFLFFMEDEKRARTRQKHMGDHQSSFHKKKRADQLLYRFWYPLDRLWTPRRDRPKVHKQPLEVV